MSSDPNNGDGDPDGADPEEKKTRFVPHDIVDRALQERAPTGAPQAKDSNWKAPGRPAGTLAEHGSSAVTDNRHKQEAACSAAPTEKMGNAKTEYDSRRRRRGRAGRWLGGGGEGAGTRRPSARSMSE